MKLNIYIEYSILCDRCGKRDETDDKAAKRFFKNILGWSTTKHGTFCESCQRKLKIK